MNIQQAIDYLTTQPCLCKQIQPVIQRLQTVLTSGVKQAHVSLTQFAIVLIIGNQQEVLCSRLLEQRL